MHHMREKLEKFSYTKKDFILDWYSGTGAGGQHRNKHQNCLRLTHIPSGITVTAQDARDRQTNIRNAFQRLKPKLEIWVKAQIGETKYPRSNELVRTYHVPDNRVIDHASGKQIAWSEIDKKFGELVDARLRDNMNKRETGLTNGR